MGGRTMPTECDHGVTVDLGDFGPCQDCSDHEVGECPNYVQCEQCNEAFLAALEAMEGEQETRRVETWQDGYTAGYQQGRNDERDGQPAPLEVPTP